MDKLRQVGASLLTRRVPTPFDVVFVVLAVVVLWSVTWTTWYVAKQNENVVIQLFGKYSRTEGPGLHGKLPWPFEEYTRVAVTQVFQEEIGFRTIDAANKKYEDIPEVAEMLTNDLKIVHVDWVVQYRAPDAKKYLFNVNDPVAAMNLMSQSAMRNVVGGQTFSSIVTTGRQVVQEGSEKMTQGLLDQIGAGLIISGVQLQDAKPPAEVVVAFRDVTNALENKGEYIQKAIGHKNNVVPRAKGDAEKIIAEATGYKNKRIAAAQGDASRFLEVLAKYEANPELTRARMRFEAIEDILPGKDQLIDFSGTQGGASNSALVKFFDASARKAAAAPASAKKE